MGNIIPKKIRLMDDIRDRLLSTGNIDDPKHAEAIARRWVEEIMIEK